MIGWRAVDSRIKFFLKSHENHDSGSLRIVDIPQGIAKVGEVWAPGSMFFAKSYGNHDSGRLRTIDIP